MITTISGSSPGAPATAALTPRPDVPGTCRIWVAAFLLGAIARHARGPGRRRMRPAAPLRRCAHLGVFTHGETRGLHYLPREAPVRGNSSTRSSIVTSTPTRARASPVINPERDAPTMTAVPWRLRCSPVEFISRL